MDFWLTVGGQRLSETLTRVLPELLEEMQKTNNKLIEIKAQVKNLRDELDMRG